MNARARIDASSPFLRLLNTHTHTTQTEMKIYFSLLKCDVPSLSIDKCLFALFLFAYFRLSSVAFNGETNVPFPTRKASTQFDFRRLCNTKANENVCERLDYIKSKRETSATASLVCCASVEFSSQFSSLSMLSEEEHENTLSNVVARVDSDGVAMN